MLLKIAVADVAGTQFTCFTGTKGTNSDAAGEQLCFNSLAAVRAGKLDISSPSLSAGTQITYSDFF